jgi:hypothetical protein
MSIQVPNLHEPSSHAAELILVIHAISGCDSISLYSLGKCTMYNRMTKSRDVISLTDVITSLDSKPDKMKVTGFCLLVF